MFYYVVLSQGACKSIVTCIEYRFRWICNPPALSISIYNAFFGFKILIINASGLQIPMSLVSLVSIGAVYISLLSKLLNSQTP